MCGITSFLGFRETPLLRVIVKFTVKNAVCMSLRLTAYGEFDCEFDCDSQEWSSSTRTWLVDHGEECDARGDLTDDPLDFAMDFLLRLVHWGTTDGMGMIERDGK